MKNGTTKCTIENEVNWENLYSYVLFIVINSLLQYPSVVACCKILAVIPVDLIAVFPPRNEKDQFVNLELN